jgi:hypothetical protein
MPEAWVSWSGTKRLKSLDMSRAPGLGPGYPCLGHWVSWSGTKMLKTLDMSRAPGLGPGCPCLGHGSILGLWPWCIRPQEKTWGYLILNQVLDGTWSSLRKDITTRGTSPICSDDKVIGSPYDMKEWVMPPCKPSLTLGWLVWVLLVYLGVMF